MIVKVEMTDDVAKRVCPCVKNGKHDHRECVAEFLETALYGTTFQREATIIQDQFKQSYERPSLKVTTE